MTPGRVLHGLGVRWLLAESHRRNDVGAEIYRQNLDHGQSKRDRQQNIEQVGKNLRAIADKDIIGKLADVEKNGAPFLNAGHNRSKIVIQKNDLSRGAGHIGATLAHGNPNICSFESWRIIYAISGHSHHPLHALERHNNFHLLGRASPCKDSHPSGKLLFELRLT